MRHRIPVSVLGAQVPDYNNVDDLPNTALVFANGPSALRHSNATTTIQRLNLTDVDTGTQSFYSINLYEWCVKSRVPSAYSQTALHIEIK